MQMRSCRECGGVFDLSGFYESDSNCKECRKAKVKAYRLANAEKVKAYEREHGRSPERKALVAERRPKYREKHRTVYTKTWQQKHPEKRSAHVIVGNAIRDGKLVKQPCEMCGNIQVHAHHDDYSKPLDVRWLCETHHGVTRRIDPPVDEGALSP